MSEWMITTKSSSRFLSIDSPKAINKMTNPEFAFDYETVKHLDAWLARNIRDESQTVMDRVRTDMLRLVRSDETYWLNQGWWKVFDAVAP